MEASAPKPSITLFHESLVARHPFSKTMLTVEAGCLMDNISIFFAGDHVRIGTRLAANCKWGLANTQLRKQKVSSGAARESA
jgi:hypothetical protein